MSMVKKLSDLVKSLPSKTAHNEFDILVSDKSGGLGKMRIAHYAIKSISSFVPGEVARIRGLQSAIVSLRGYNSGRCASAWISSYGNGQDIRTSTVSFRCYGGYQWYINGESDNLATIYIKNANDNATSGDEISVVSLLSEISSIEIVDSLPSDATPLNL